MALAFGLAAHQARAQVAGSLRVDSDYRWRGESLSDGRPALRLQLGWDGSAGAFAGLSAGTARLGSEHGGWQITGHAGYAHRGVGKRPGWEVGLLATHFSTEPQAGYGEVFAGLLGSGWSVRLYASPNYYGRGAPTSYVEFDTAWTVAPGWRILFHAGAQTWLDGAPTGMPRTRADVLSGLSWTLRDAQFQLAWNSRSGHALYPYGTMRDASHSAWVLSASYAF
jgi:uncharacterized protein (TIGR02001 family)